VNNLNHVVRFETNGWMLSTRDNFRVAFDGYRPAEIQVLEEKTDRDVVRDVLGFTVDRDPHAASG
jgi:hypothetical protein